MHAYHKKRNRVGGLNLKQKEKQNMKQIHSSQPSPFGYYDNYSYRGQERSRLSESGGYQQPHRSPYFFYGIPPHVTPSPSHGYPMYGVVSDWVTDILPNDVLSGRGGATNSHSGNRAFRSLVKDYQDQYLKAKKRDKPAVASIIVETIRQKGGRFLRRMDTTPSGEILWTDIGDDRAREKTCQALRENAPELRKKRSKATSLDEEDANNNSIVALSASCSIDRTTTTTTTASTEENRILQSTKGSGISISSTTTSRGIHHPGLDEPIVIRPSAILTKLSFSEAIPIDQLEPHERELYLKDFLPPNPATRKKKNHSQPPMHSSVHPFDHVIVEV